MLRALRFGLRKLKSATPAHSGSADHANPSKDEPVIWAHVATYVQAHALIELAERLRRDIFDLHMVLSVSDAIEDGTELRPDLPWLTVLADKSDFEMRPFNPAVAIFATEFTPSSVIDHLALQGVPMFLVDATRPERRSALYSRWKSVQKTLLSDYRRIYVADTAAERWYIAASDSPERIENAGPLQLGVAIPPTDMDARQALTLGLASRPMWLCCDCPPTEAEIVAKAHKSASRGAHKLLLIVCPAAGSDPADLQSTFTGLELRTDLQSLKGYPDTETQVLILDEDTDRGLWYHLAPISYMGGTLSGHPSQNPYYPAALGSAVIHGSDICSYRPFFEALEQAGGSCTISDISALKTAVTRLIIPDQNADQVQKALNVATLGAELVNSLQEEVLTALEDRGYA